MCFFFQNILECTRYTSPPRAGCKQKRSYLRRTQPKSGILTKRRVTFFTNRDVFQECGLWIFLTFCTPGKNYYVRIPDHFFFFLFFSENVAFQNFKVAGIVTFLSGFHDFFFLRLLGTTLKNPADLVRIRCDDVFIASDPKTSRQLFSRRRVYAWCFWYTPITYQQSEGGIRLFSACGVPRI